MGGFRVSVRPSCKQYSMKISLLDQWIIMIMPAMVLFFTFFYLNSKLKFPVSDISFSYVNKKLLLDSFLQQFVKWMSNKSNFVFANSKLTT
jgi:hypothetical protein